MASACRATDCGNPARASTPSSRRRPASSGASPSAERSDAPFPRQDEGRAQFALFVVRQHRACGGRIDPLGRQVCGCRAARAPAPQQAARAALRVRRVVHRAGCDQPRDDIVHERARGSGLNGNGLGIACDGGAACPAVDATLQHAAQHGLGGRIVREIVECRIMQSGRVRRGADGRCKLTPLPLREGVGGGGVGIGAAPSPQPPPAGGGGECRRVTPAL